MKKYLIGIFALLLLLNIFSCSSSPTAMKVGTIRIDASEYAYYLNYNRLNLDNLTSAGVLPGEGELLAQARSQTEQQIERYSIIRLECQKLGLELSSEQKSQMEEEKQQLIDSLGGLYGYLEYLRSNALTDRLYDKLQENNHYYAMLYEYVTSGEDSGVYTDQQLRQYFADNYIKVKYIRFSTLDQSGSLLEEDELNGILETAESVLESIQSGQMTFDEAMSLYNDDPIMTASPGGITVSAQDGGTEYIADAFELSDSETGGVYAYSDGFYILNRQAVDLGYFDENRDQITSTARDWAFDNYISSASQNVAVSKNSVCGKITFENLFDYVK